MFPLVSLASPHLASVQSNQPYISTTLPLPPCLASHIASLHATVSHQEPPTLNRKNFSAGSGSQRSSSGAVFSTRCPTLCWPTNWKETTTSSRCRFRSSSTYRLRCARRTAHPLSKRRCVSLPLMLVLLIGLGRNFSHLVGGFDVCLFDVRLKRCSFRRLRAPR